MVFRMCYLYINRLSECVHFRIIPTTNKVFVGIGITLFVCLSVQMTFKFNSSLI